MKLMITHDAEAQQSMFSCRRLLEHVQWIIVNISEGTDHAQCIIENI